MKAKLIITSLLIIIIISVQPDKPLPLNYFEESLKNSNLNLSNLSKEPSLDKINYSISYIYNSEGHEAEYYILLHAQNLDKGQYYYSYLLGLNGNGNFSILYVNFKLKNATYELKKNIIYFKFQLFNNEKLEINLKYKVVKKELNKFHRYENIYLPKTNYYGEIKVSTTDDMTIINTNNYILQKLNNNNYIWKGNLNEEIKENLRIGYISGKWNTNFKATLTSINQNQIKNAYIITPRLYKGGNNKIKSYSFSSSLSNTLDGINIIDNLTHYKFEFKTLNKKEAFIEIKTEFTNIGNITWDYYLDNFPLFKPKSSSTELTIIKVKEILNNDKSTDPDHIKIGKWVYKNMKYDISQTGKKKTVDEILESIKKKENIRHAWTLAKINNKWIPYDSTWNIFTGILPISHIYERFNLMNIYYTSNYVYSDNYDIQFKGFDNDYIEENKEGGKFFIILFVVVFIIFIVGFIVYFKFFKGPSSSSNYDARNNLVVVGL